MFYECIKMAYKAGKVRIGLPSLYNGDRVTIEANGLIALKAAFLTGAERQQLAELFKANALAEKPSLPRETSPQPSKATNVQPSKACSRLSNEANPQPYFGPNGRWY
jgi:hypothetical protein